MYKSMLNAEHNDKKTIRTIIVEPRCQYIGVHLLTNKKGCTKEIRNCEEIVKKEDSCSKISSEKLRSFHGLNLDIYGILGSISLPYYNNTSKHTNNKINFPIEKIISSYYSNEDPNVGPTLTNVYDVLCQIGYVFEFY